MAAARVGDVCTAATPIHELTGQDLELLREIGLASVIDLRTANEVERTGRGVLGSEPVRYVNLSVLPEPRRRATKRLGHPDRDVAERYLSYLEVGKTALVESFGVITDPKATHSYFTARPARTVLRIGGPVLSCLGVEPSTIVDDYVLTATTDGPISAGLRRESPVRRSHRRMPAVGLRGRASTIHGFLDGLRAAIRRSARMGSSAGVAETR